MAIRSKHGSGARTGKLDKLSKATAPAGPRRTNPDVALQALKERLGEVADLSSATAVLGWDQATYMPKGGAKARGAQLSMLSRLAHERFVDPQIGALLDQLEPHVQALPYAGDDRSLVRVVGRDYERARRVPSALVADIAAHANAAYVAWTAARPANDFEAVEGLLEVGVRLGRQLAEALGPYDHVMDPLIDGAEPGMKTATIRALFSELRTELVPMVAAAAQSSPVDCSCLKLHYPEAKQLAFGLKMAERFGFDLTRGRQDKSPHPFMTMFSLGDVRITTRVSENDLSEALYSTLHEAGHAMYEQGVSPTFERTPLAGGCSAGLHESQSRLWENIVGRGAPFLTFAYPMLQRQFPDQLKRVPLGAFSKAINRVAPSLIRTDADELTYNLHVMIRFELECQMLEGTLKVKDLPETWADAYERDLGVRPTDHSSGCLQDVHWFSGTVGGAFQSYTIGNILAAQFYAAAIEAHPKIPDEIADGRFATLHGWLQKNIYVHGRKFLPHEIVEMATGKPMTIAPYVSYLRTKYKALDVI
jgi:carboxypeptidase Taq